MDSGVLTSRRPVYQTAPRPERILRPDRTAIKTGLSLSTLAKMRGRGDGPPFVRLGPRCVGYLETDLDRWLKAGRTTSTRPASPVSGEDGAG